MSKGETLKLNSITPEQHFTEPPPRYSEATLVKALEEKGIGRPSTYAAIMTTIQDREYVEKIEGRFHPTPLGMTVNDLLLESFDDIFNATYTARMEEELDEIEDGKLEWRDGAAGVLRQVLKRPRTRGREHQGQEKNVDPDRRGLRKMRLPEW